MYRKIYKDDNKDLASTMCNLANYYLIIGNFAKAEPLYIESNSMRKRIFKKIDADLANGIANYSVLLIKQSRFIEAELFCKEAMEMYLRLPEFDSSRVATMYNNLAYSYYSIGKYSEAEENYKIAGELRRKISTAKLHNIASDFNNLAVLYRDKGRYSDAEPLFLKALELYKSANKGDHYDIAKCLGNLGALFLIEGRFKEAEEFSNNSLDMIRRLFKEDSPDLSKGIASHAQIMEELKHYDNAESLFKEALSIDKKLYTSENQEIVKKQLNLGNLYIKTRQYKEAEKLFQEALSASKSIFKDNNPLTSNCYKHFGRLYFVEKLYDLAEINFSESLEIDKSIYGDIHPSIAENIFMLALIYDIKTNFENAEKYFINSLNLFKQIYSRNAANLSETEKEQYWNNIKTKFDYFYSFALRRKLINPAILKEMFNNVLFAKGLLLNSSVKIKNQILNTGNNELINKYKNWQSQKEFLVGLYKLTKNELKEKKVNLDSVEKFTNKLEKELADITSNFNNQFDSKIFDYNDIRQNIPDSTILVEIIRFHRASGGVLSNQINYAVLILDSKNDNPELVLLENGRQLDSSLYLIYKDYNTDFGDNSSSAPNAKYSKKYYELYKNYWQPIEKNKRYKKNVILSPDGVFNQINILTLLNQNDNRYLIEKVNLNLITSSRDLMQNNLQIAKSLKNSAVLIGFPNYNLDLNSLKSSKQENVPEDSYEDVYHSNMSTIKVQDLPETQVEINSIKNILENTGWSAKVYTENAAMEDSVKSVVSPTILHIATHGFFLSEDENQQFSSDEGTNILGTDLKKSQENPLLRSGLLFAGVNNINNTHSSHHNHQADDGILTAFEAQNLILDGTELVVLSACETAKGEVRNGEGVYGLQRAFKVAGAKNIIMSLWKVDDESAQMLMTKFYQNYSQTKDLKKSFREAQNYIKKIKKAPYFWGSFILVGY
jgi:CHAT domain-containing protein